MRYRSLGNSGLQVSVVGLGSWLTFGNTVNLDTTRACVHAAWERGVNFLDTANVYAGGAAEETLGSMISELEREFQIKIPDSDLNPRKFESIERIDQYVGRALANRSR